MKFCSNCGKEVDENAVVCLSCGAAIKSNEVANEDDTGGFAYGALGCCIPIVGIILYFVWKGNKPKSAKSAGIGALVGMGAIILFYVIIFMIAWNNPYNFYY